MSRELVQRAEGIVAMMRKDVYEFLGIEHTEDCPTDCPHQLPEINTKPSK